MTKRPCGMMLRFTRAELDTLTKKARKANMSREGFCRTVLNGAVVKEAPAADVPVLLRDVRRVGYNIDQILKVANSQGLVDVPKLRKALDENHAASQAIIEAFTVADR